jgi:hypothetical protein
MDGFCWQGFSHQQRESLHGSANEQMKQVRESISERLKENH